MFRFGDGKEIASWVFLGLFSIIVIAMLSSFVSRMIISPPVDPSSGEYTEDLEEVIQVNIMNGCGVAGLAAGTKEFMRYRGFDVVEIGNNKDKAAKSMVIDRLGNIESAKKVAYALGISDSMVVSKIDSNLFLHCTVVLGDDYSRLKPFAAE